VDYFGLDCLVSEQKGDFMSFFDAECKATPIRIARLATVPFFFQNHLISQIRQTVEAGCELTLICSPGPEISLLREIPGIRVIEVKIERKIKPVSDLLALLKLVRLFRSENFDIVHTTTPKAGLLGMCAAFACSVPVRIHTFTGQAWIEWRGLLRRVGWLSDWLIGRISTHCYADSASQRRFLIDDAVISCDRISVLGSGSLAGVDLSRFNKELHDGSRDVLSLMGIEKSDFIITFLGRVNLEKGLRELILAFRLVQEFHPKSSLLIIGPLERDGEGFLDGVSQEMLASVHFLGYQSAPEVWLAATDLLCLPSYREGFGNVVIEAAALGVPAIGTSIPGLEDAIIDGETGVLVQPKDIEALAMALKEFILNGELRQKMGVAARVRAMSDFSSLLVNKLVIDEYFRLFTEAARLNGR
jgi:glycosyltransferase involved in cell wall biosynthesis